MKGDSNRSKSYSRSNAPWRIAIRKFFARPGVEIFIGGLVLVSVILTLLELWLEARIAASIPVYLSGYGPLNTYHLEGMMMLNDFITTIFVVELFLDPLRHMIARVVTRMNTEEPSRVSDVKCGPMVDTNGRTRAFEKTGQLGLESRHVCVTFDGMDERKW